MASGRGPYPQELKAQAVRRLRSGEATLAELSRELEVPRSTIRGWLRQAGHGEGEPLSVVPSRPTEPAETMRVTPGEEHAVRKFARLTADAIEISVTVLTLPAEWAVSGLRWYANRPSS